MDDEGVSGVVSLKQHLSELGKDQAVEDQFLVQRDAPIVGIEVLDSLVDGAVIVARVVVEAVGFDASWGDQIVREDGHFELCWEIVPELRKLRSHFSIDYSSRIDRSRMFEVLGWTPPGPLSLSQRHCGTVAVNLGGGGILSQFS